MIKRIFFSAALLVPAGVILFSAKVNSFSNGNPPACTGSPSDKITCSSNCHNGSVNKAETGWITSNIPAAGYIPDSSYTITCTATGEAASEKFGFEASPQFETGKTAGKMILINTNETKLIGGGKYISQILGGVSGSGSRSWSFKWIAPSKGSGPLTFYAAFLIGGKPQTVVTSSSDIKEAQ